MKGFNRLSAAAVLVAVIVIAAVNTVLLRPEKTTSDKEYIVEISRLAMQIEDNGGEIVDVSNCRYVTAIVKQGADGFFTAEGEYRIHEINGILYRFDYEEPQPDRSRLIIAVNAALLLMAGLLIGVLAFLRSRLIRPFEELKNIPYELSKGNLTVPIKENKSRFFGKFTWGLDLLRQKLEDQKQRELALQKEKKTLLLSLSHDIKTPLSAIKLYSKALSKGLYKEKEKQMEAAEGINHKADELEQYVTQIIEAAREDFLSLDVEQGEFYLHDLTDIIRRFYTDKLDIYKTSFTIADHGNCLLKGDLDRAVEVIQNLMENAIKYGDGREISIGFAEEEGCLLISVRNSGGDLPDIELPHIFESFWRGSNISDKDGSGLGLYICRQLMTKMNGDIFAELTDSGMSVTTVFVKS